MSQTYRRQRRSNVFPLWAMCCSPSFYSYEYLSVNAKFHCAIWSQTGSKLVAVLQLVLDDRPNFCSLHVCDQLRTSATR